MSLDFAKVCGKHSAIFEAYYKQIDPKDTGAIEAMTAAKFLKKSGLSDVILSRVWDLSDPNGKGFLDKPGFFVALKLVSLAQAGQTINMSNIYMETANPPKVGDLPKIIPPRVPTGPAAAAGVPSGDWSISVIDRLKYEQLFESLKPVGGMLPGLKVKGVLMESKLPTDTLGKIWDLADQDKDGNLDKHEFIVAMHLVYQTLNKRVIPNVLPPELRKNPSSAGPPAKPVPPASVAVAEPSMDGGFVANFPKDIAPPPVVPQLANAIPSIPRIPPIGATPPLIPTDPLIPIGAPPSVTSTADWVVTPAELKRYEIMFRDSDRDKDGLVSGLEVKNVFLQSGVAQNCLAHIWALCDTNQSGKLTLEQFALAMWMVERKQKGIEPPQVLTAAMVPPSMRSIVSGVDLTPQAEPKPTYSNPELEMISKEIEELAKERRLLETEIAQKEADIRIKSGEVRSLQSELDTLSATLKQLENQRGEAQKRLDDLKAQVNKIREQCQKQEETINEQEGELNAKRSELQKLKDEEAALQKEYDENNRELQKLTQHLQSTQLQISSVRSMVTQLIETQRQMTDALLMCRAAIDDNDTDIVSEYQLKIEPDFYEAREVLKRKLEESKPDPFDDNETKTVNTKSTTNGFDTDPFAGTGGGEVKTVRSSGFDDSFSGPSGFDSGFDAFGTSNAFNTQKDPFGSDAFEAKKSNAVSPEPGKDDFGSDPFAALHAPTGQGQVLSPNAQKTRPPPRPESPSPALPPKKSKVPPPRPAPPRPLQGPPRPAQPDAFGSTTTSGGFADFADFDNKLSITQLPRAANSTIQSNSSLSSESHGDTGRHSATAGISTDFGRFSSSTSSSVSTSIPSFAIDAPAARNTPQSHLIRSTTPLQQSTATVFSHMTQSTANKNNVISSGTGTGTSSRSTSVISGPTDFKDDPFKDYRYEDPFNIKDPFDDDDDDNTVFADPEKVFKDDLSSDDGDDDNDKYNDRKKAPSKMGNTKNSLPFNDFADFETESVQRKSPDKTIFDGMAALMTTKPATVGMETAGIFTDNTKKSLDSGKVSSGFADFDAFAEKQGLAVVTKSSLNNQQSDAFLDAFGNGFDANKNIESGKKSSATLFDPFAGAIADNRTPGASAFTATTNANAFDAFGPCDASAKVKDDLFGDSNAFEDDFFQQSNVGPKNGNNSKFSLSFNNNNNNNNNIKTKENYIKTSSSEGFDKFNAFDDDNATPFEMKSDNALNNSVKISPFMPDSSLLDKLQNPTTLSKRPNTSSSNKIEPNVNDNVGGYKVPDKFASDYSKPEAFDADLEEALKRSLTDQ